jgi:hypothetical protein
VYARAVRNTTNESVLVSELSNCSHVVPHVTTLGVISFDSSVPSVGYVPIGETFILRRSTSDGTSTFLLCENF